MAQLQVTVTELSVIVIVIYALSNYSITYQGLTGVHKTNHYRWTCEIKEDVHNIKNSIIIQITFIPHLF